MRRERSGASGGTHGTVAMLVCAAQSGALVAGVLVVQFGSADPYGRPPGPAFGFLAVVVLGPPRCWCSGRCTRSR